MSDRSPFPTHRPSAVLPLSALPAVVAAGLGGLVLVLLVLGITHVAWPVEEPGNALIRELFTALLGGLCITLACGWAAWRVGSKAVLAAEEPAASPTTAKRPSCSSRAIRPRRNRLWSSTTSRRIGG